MTGYNHHLNGSAEITQQHTIHPNLKNVKLKLHVPFAEQFLMDDKQKCERSENVKSLKQEEWVPSMYMLQYQTKVGIEATLDVIYQNGGSDVCFLMLMCPNLQKTEVFGSTHGYKSWKRRLICSTLAGISVTGHLLC